MPEINVITTDKLTSDFEAFESKLNSLPKNPKPRYKEMHALLKGELTLTKIQDKDPKIREAKIEEFYLLFAEFTEDSNFVKMLYQVLLEEYAQLGIFNFGDYAKIKEAAINKIATLIKSDSWDGDKKNEIRAKYRFKMLEL